MSWQRILELARQRNFPVIVTDVAGREPLVIVPFAEYERMGEGGGGKMQEASSKRQEGIRRQDLETEAFVEFEAEELQKQVDAAVAGLVQAPSGEGSMSLEERFYLEPVEEESK